MYLLFKLIKTRFLKRFMLEVISYYFNIWVEYFRIHNINTKIKTSILYKNNKIVQLRRQEII